MIDRFISALRDSHPAMVDIFKNGSCYQLFLIIRTVYPNAAAWHDPVAGHVYVEVNGQFYDIDGRVYQLPPRAHKFTRETWPKHAPHRWPPLQLVSR